MGLKMAKYFLGFILFVLFSCENSNSPSNDNNDAEPIADSISVKIGNQVWMIRNLDVDTFRNGDKIPDGNDANVRWKEKGINKEPAWCYHTNSKTQSYKGALYNWHAVNDPRGLAPKGWRIPTKKDWKILEEYLIAHGYNYDSSRIGNKIGKSLTTSWGDMVDKEGAIGSLGYNWVINKSKFNAMQSYGRDSDGSWPIIMFPFTIWWSSDEDPSGWVFARCLFPESVGLDEKLVSKNGGYSVRCIKE
jgi:uncharacterized protein (TIGR02145 family)